MESEKHRCKIWAWETDPNDGSAHFCHAAFHGFNGNRMYAGENEITKILKETPRQISTYVWMLKRCEPVYDDTNCKKCRYHNYNGINY